MIWKQSRLGELVEVAAGQGAPQRAEEFSETGTPFVRAGSLDKLVNGGTLDDCEHLTDAIARTRGLRLFPKDTILFAKSGQSATKDRVYRLPSAAYVVNHLAALVPTRQCDPGFLTYWLRRNPPSRLIRDDAYPSIRLSEIAELPVDAPDKSEQRRIAAILDKADAIRRKRRQALAETDTLLRSVFLDMFGDPVRNTRQLPKERLEAFIEFMTSGSRGWARYYAPTGDTFLRIGNVAHGRLNLQDVVYVKAPNNAEARRTLVKPGDVLVSITADLGRTAVVPEELSRAYINQHLAAIRLRNLDPIYLSAFLASKGGQIQFERMNRTGVKAGLNFDDLKSLELIVPDQRQQKNFRKAAERIKSLHFSLYGVVSSADACFASLSQRAFRGEL